MITATSPILSIMLAKGVGTRTLSGIVDALPALGASLDELGVNALADGLSWGGKMRDHVLAAREKADELARLLEAENIRVLVRGMAPYPHRLVRVLGKQAPPVLFAQGNLALLGGKGVGFCGSRHASEKGIHVAAASARLLGARGINVVSGYAKGVDLAAHCAALQAGGTTAIVLAEGILHFRARREIKALFTDDNHLVISEFSPRLPWNARNAMQRNNTIIGLSDALIVIESGTTGGTHACATSALALGQPVFVADYATPAESAKGNEQFLSQGAIPLRGDRQGRPNLTRLYEMLGIAGPEEKNANGEDDNANVIPSLRTTVSGSAEKPAVEEINTKPGPDEPKGATYPKRLIEVDLPIARISAHARREKSIRHGHISTLHIWWARRPLAACRAVICAALWPDPADRHCPQSFRDAAARQLVAFARRVNPEKISGEKQQLQATLSPESRARWEAFAKSDPPLDPNDPAHQNVLRFALLDFIADFANWDNSTVPAYLETSRALTQAAHEALGGEPGTRPLVVDPFAGGGSIPLEALRVGADAFASDLNPVAVLLNKVVLEYIPKYGQRLADEVRKWGQWIKEQAEKELAEFYPKDPDGATPIAYLWARTIRCEGAGCGAEVPLVRSLWLAKKGKRSVALRILANTGAQRIEFELIHAATAKDVGEGTAKRGSTTCPCCGYTTPVTSVRAQLKARRGGAADARLFCVVTTHPNTQGRFYRLSNDRDLQAVANAATELERRKRENTGPLSLVPEEEFTGVEPRRIPVPLYGMQSFADLFSPRQLLSLVTLARIIREIPNGDQGAAKALRAPVQLAMAFTLDKLGDLANSLCPWEPLAECPRHLFARQAMAFTWDFAEGVPIGESSGSWSILIDRFVHVMQEVGADWFSASPVRASATKHPLPDQSAQAVITDPPYYYSVPYSDLSDFFYVWLRRTVGSTFPELLSDALTPKGDECVQNLPHAEVAHLQKSRQFYEQHMLLALAEGERIVQRDGIGTVVFAHSDTDAWESLLNALVNAGWMVTASWPIDTEMESRIVAQRQRTLASSVHLVCRPRTMNETGDWRDVLAELPQRMHEWMPRLASEGVVGADAIFACLGPALEIFSRYSRVEKTNGEVVPLGDVKDAEGRVVKEGYLSHVWAAVSKEALSTIFRDADATGLEPDARLTAMWLWTLGGAKGKADLGNRVIVAINEAHNRAAEVDESDEAHDEESGNGKAGKSNRAGFFLEFDAARKIAQGLGIHLEQSSSIVEVKGDTAKLLPVAERTKYLFGKDAESGPVGGKKAKKQVRQPSLFDDLEAAEEADGGWKELKGPPPGTTILDRLHQAMILFGAQRGELLKRFLVEEGVGKDARFWKLAQSLAALYPPGTDERRWVEGVLARKKGLGL